VSQPSKDFLDTKFYSHSKSVNGGWVTRREKSLGIKILSKIIVSSNVQLIPLEGVSVNVNLPNNPVPLIYKESYNRSNMVCI